MNDWRPGDEATVLEPWGHDNCWVLPGERLFVIQLGSGGKRARVRCPMSTVDMWLNANRLVAPTQTDIVHRLAVLEQRYELLKRRTTMLLAAVVVAADPKDKATIRLLGKTFAENIEEPHDPEVDEALQEVEEKTPTKTYCDCVRADEMIHDPGCLGYPVGYPPESAVEELDDGEWKANPYSLPPATNDGPVCPACSSASRWGSGQRVSLRIHHEDQATVDECMRRQKAMGWRPPADGPEEGYIWA